MARLRGPETAAVDIHNDTSSERQFGRASTDPTTPSLSPGRSSDKENTDSAAGAMQASLRRHAPDDDDHDKERPAKSRRKDKGPAIEVPQLEHQDTQYFDPNQDLSERRKLRTDYRELQKEAVENRQEWLKADNDGAMTAIKRAKTLFGSVKQTSDATIDSRFLTTVGDITLKKSQRIAMEEGAQGIDVDQFVAKCIAFMNAGDRDRPRHPQRNADPDDSDNEEENDIGDALNWAWLGSQACFPVNLRPPVPGFLLGPLSIQKRARKVTQRRATQQRNTNQVETRPDELRAEDLQKSENGTLVALCNRIKKRLIQVKSEGVERAEAELNDDMTDAQQQELMERNNIADDEGVPLFAFVLHPTSFGQSVENLFYVSFLIRDGLVEVSHDSEGMPTLRESLPIISMASEYANKTIDSRSKDDTDNNLSSGNGRPRTGLRHQAVFSLDYDTWKGLVKDFKITESLIPDRGDDAGPQVGATGWYQ